MAKLNYPQSFQLSAMEQFILWQMPLLIISTKLLYAASFAVFQCQIYWLLGLISLGLWDFYNEYSMVRNTGLNLLHRSGHILLICLFCFFTFGLRPLVGAWALGHQPWGFESRLAEANLVNEAQFWYMLGLSLLIIVYICAMLIPNVDFNFHLGWRPSQEDAVFILATSLTTVTVMVLYFQHQLHYGGLLSAMSSHSSGAGAGYWLAGTMFSIFNSLDEELWYRGVLLGLLRPFLPRKWANVLQAGMFAFLHIATMFGSLGGLLITGLFGGLMGWWTIRRGSIWPAVIVHAVVDFVIFAYLY